MLACVLGEFLNSSTALAESDFNFHLPSSIALNGASGSDQTRSVSLDANLSLHSNLQLGIGFTRSNFVLNDDSFSFNETRFSVGTDPLNTFSGTLLASLLTNGSDTRQLTANAEMMWSPGAWIFAVTPGYGTISTSNRPNIYQQDSEIQFHQASLAASAEWFVGKGFSLRAAGATFSYDNDLSYLSKASTFSQTFNVDVIPPSSQELFTVLPSTVFSIGVNFSRPTWSIGLEAGQMKTFVNDDVENSLKLSGSIRLARSWSLIASVAQLPSFTSDTTTSTRLGIVHTW